MIITLINSKKTADKRLKRISRVKKGGKKDERKNVAKLYFFSTCSVDWYSNIICVKEKKYEENKPKFLTVEEIQEKNETWRANTYRSFFCKEKGVHS